jgi:hypothetical protein
MGGEMRESFETSKASMAAKSFDTNDLGLLMHPWHI